MKQELLKQFNPFELDVTTFGLFEIYPANLVQKFESV